MSMWSYVKGVVTVEPPGHGQAAMDFVLCEVVDHLPRVTGSEGDMHVEIVRREGHNQSCNHDEFGVPSNLGRSPWGGRGGWFDAQCTYDLLLTGSLRDRWFDDTLREFSKWMVRLSKRVFVEDVFVKVYDMYGRLALFNGGHPWRDNFEGWSWMDGDDRSPMHSVRRSCDFRYSAVPLEGNWTERLITLLPGGNGLAHEVDMLTGNLDWYEYDPDKFKALAESYRNEIDATEKWVEELESSGRFEDGD